VGSSPSGSSSAISINSPASILVTGFAGMGGKKDGTIDSQLEQLNRKGLCCVARLCSRYCRVAFVGSTS